MAFPSIFVVVILKNVIMKIGGNEVQLGSGSPPPKINKYNN